MNPIFETSKPAVKYITSTYSTLLGLSTRTPAPPQPLIQPPASISPLTSSENVPRNKNEVQHRKTSPDETHCVRRPSNNDGDLTEGPEATARAQTAPPVPCESRLATENVIDDRETRHDAHKPPPSRNEICPHAASISDGTEASEHAEISRASQCEGLEPAQLERARLDGHDAAEARRQPVQVEIDPAQLEDENEDARPQQVITAGVDSDPIECADIPHNHALPRLQEAQSSEDTTPGRQENHPSGNSGKANNSADESDESNHTYVPAHPAHDREGVLPEACRIAGPASDLNIASHHHATIATRDAEGVVPSKREHHGHQARIRQQHRHTICRWYHPIYARRRTFIFEMIS